MTRVVQLELGLGKPEVGWGGKREGAGRKPTGKQYVRHLARPFHEADRPVHVTYRVRRDVPSLRARHVAEAIVGMIAAAAKGKAQRTFRVCHYSIQSNHVHLVVEATSKRALAKGMLGLASGMARRINRAVGRRGKVFVERYHARELATPREVRNVLRYVLLNRAHHAGGGGRDVSWNDQLSSARWFDGWAWNPFDDRAAEAPAPTRPPATWLLAKGWRRGGGWIDPREVPG